MTRRNVIVRRDLPSVLVSPPSSTDNHALPHLYPPQCTMRLSHCKHGIRYSSQISTTAPIFLLSNYFRQKYLEIASCAVSLLNNIWVRVEHSLLQQLNLQKVNWNSSSLQAGCEINFGDELNTSLKTASNILHDAKNYEKYLYISDCIFTMLLGPDKKTYFEVYPTPATGFLPMTASFWTNMW